MEKILAQYGFVNNEYEIQDFGSGLINRTWIIKKGAEKYILQKINNSVFKTPEAIDYNINLINDYLQQHHSSYYFTGAVATAAGKTLVHTAADEYYRMFEFVKDSHSIDVVETPAQAFEAAKQFGRFTKLLSGIAIEKLKITLPSFHDLSLRYQQFLTAVAAGNKTRIEESRDLVQYLQSLASIVDEYESIKVNPDFKLRVTHHDTKISNILFDKNDKGICVIDLDTIMPGYFISDVGDMMRTYLCPVSEEEKDFSKIAIRNDFYKAIVNGYRGEMDTVLTDKEKQYFFYSGTFMIYMQALRFATDYLNNDVYYGSKYEGHNFVRAQNQAILLQKLLEKEAILCEL